MKPRTYESETGEKASSHSRPCRGQRVGDAVQDMPARSAAGVKRGASAAWRFYDAAAIHAGQRQ